MEITGAVAVVTGGASGLGLATATHLRDAGMRVVVIDLPNGPAADIAAARGFIFAPADVSDAGQVEAGIAAAEALGSLRVLVTCAGIAQPGRVVGRNGPLPLTDFARVLNVNLLGTFNAIRLAAAAMMRTEPVGEERGVIVTTASVAAFDGQIGQPAYAASKAGVAGMTLPIARELASSLIRVVSIAPGIFETPMMAGLPQSARDSLGAQVPHPSRLGHPEEFAALVMHVIANPMLNGETIRLDGGIRMGPR